MDVSVQPFIQFLAAHPVGSSGHVRRGIRRVPDDRHSIFPKYSSLAVKAGAVQKPENVGFQVRFLRHCPLTNSLCRLGGGLKSPISAVFSRCTC